MFCDWCRAEFDDILALGRHISTERRAGRGHQDDEFHGERKSGKGRGTVPSTGKINTHCPNCNFEIPYTTAWGSGDCTVCPKCLCMFDTHQVDSTTGAYVILRKHEGASWAGIYAQSKAYFTWSYANWPALRGLKVAERDMIYRLPDAEREERLRHEMPKVRQ